jgi:hypothetical protein
MLKFLQDLLPSLGGFIPAFLATVLPAVFLIANAIIKRTLFKQTDFHLFGGDMVFCGSVLFASDLLRELSVGHLRDGLKTAAYVLMLLLFFLVWLLVLWIGSKRNRVLSVVAALVGAVIFSCCSAATWSMLQSVKNSL